MKYRKDFEDLTGKRFGRWEVICLSEKTDSRKRKFWLCRCSCDLHNEKIVRSDILKSGQSQSCGCLHSEISSTIGKHRKKHNEYNLSGNYGIGYTTNTNEEFYFDLEEYDKIKDYTWMKDGYGYIWSIIDTKPTRFHRFILGLKTDVHLVDHINRIKYDNRKCNLRIATYSENNHNTDLQKNNKSGKKGVHKHMRGGYNAQITFEGEIKRKHFKTLKEAISQRRQWELDLFGYYFDN